MSIDFVSVSYRAVNIGIGRALISTQKEQQSAFLFGRLTAAVHSGPYTVHPNRVKQW